MRFQSALTSWLTKARPGNAKPETYDGTLGISPSMVHAGRFPFPFTKTLGSADTLAAGEDVQGSFTATRLDAQGTALNLTPWVAMPPGVWDIDLEYSQRLVGAVSDLTAISTLLLLIVDGGVTRNHVIAQLHGGQTLPQVFRRRFTLTVSKDIPTQFSLQHAIGLGTAVNIARASLMAFRIL